MTRVLLKEALISFKRFIRKLSSNCPRHFRAFGAPLLGGTIGLAGGIPGFLIGLLLGWLLGELLRRTFRDRKILAYLENPGPQRFYEGEPGLAAWCALAFLVAAERDTAGDSLAADSGTDEKILNAVTLGASYAFAGSQIDLSLAEHFARLALSKRKSLSPDLLAESLASRRASEGDAGKLGRALFPLADGEKARNLAEEICLVLDPSLETGRGPGKAASGFSGDPWEILGLPFGTPLKEVKIHYRRLAKLFHPDELEALDERQRESAARAFIAINQAYKHISGGQF